MKKIFWSCVVFLLVFGTYLGYKLYMEQREIKQTKEVNAIIQIVSDPQAFYSVGGKSLPDSVDVFFDKNIAAPNALHNKKLAGFQMSPEISGSWQFIRSDKLRFTPQENWVPNETYKVVLPKDILAEGVSIKKRSFTFNSPKFLAKLNTSAFYENPKDIRQKSVTASFEFSYPIKEDRIKNGVKILTTSGKSYDFTYTLTNDGTVLNIISEPVKLGKEDDFANITVSGVRNIYNNAKVQYINDTKGAKVLIPDASSFFKVKKIWSDLIRDEANNPEQIVAIEFTTKVDAESLKDKMEIFYCNNDSGCKDKTALKNFTKLEFEPLPVVEGENIHFFKYYLPKKYATLMVNIKEGVRSAEEYPLRGVKQLISSVNYPQEVSIQFDGAIIPLKNHKQINFSSRGVPTLKVKIARIFDDDLNHLVTQSGGKFATPYFNTYDFDEKPSPRT